MDMRERAASTPVGHTIAAEDGTATRRNRRRRLTCILPSLARRALACIGGPAPTPGEGAAGFTDLRGAPSRMRPEGTLPAPAPLAVAPV